MPPTLAAIIPVYNRPRLVLEALESVAAQTRAPDVLIVVDDGSSDDTAARVQAWLEARRLAYPARLVRQANAGASAARNRGVAEAGAVELLAFLDSDDLWPADYLQRMASALGARPEAVAAAADRRNLDRRGGAVKETHASYAHVNGAITRQLILQGYPGTPNTVLRADHFRAVGGFDPKQIYGEDYQLQLRLSLRGPWLHVPGAPVTVRVGFHEAGGEEPHIGVVQSDRRYQLVEMLDRFVEQEGGRAAAGPDPGGQIDRHLGALWYKAGRKLMELGRRGEAARCFQQAAMLRPWHLKARWFAATVRDQPRMNTDKHG